MAEPLEEPSSKFEGTSVCDRIRNIRLRALAAKKAATAAATSAADAAAAAAEAAEAATAATEAAREVANDADAMLNEIAQRRRMAPSAGSIGP